MSWKVGDALRKWTSVPAATRATVGANVQPSILMTEALASVGVAWFSRFAVAAATGRHGAGRGPAECEDEGKTGQQESDSAAHRGDLRASDCLVLVHRPSRRGSRGPAG